MADIVRPPKGPRLDVDALEKGSVVDVIEIELLTGAARDTDAFSFGLMRLVAEIKVGRPDLYPRTEQGSIVLMTDEQAAVYNRKALELGVKRVGRVVQDSARVNPNQLPEAARLSHEAVQQVGVMMALQGAKDLRQLRLAETLRLKKG